MRFCIVLLCWTVAGCAIGPPPVAPTLDAAPTAQTWPEPPEQPRYAYVRTLIGEQDFVDKNAQPDRFGKVFNWIVGLAVGKPRYAELQRPVTGMTDEAGRIYVVDSAQHAVIVFDIPGKRLLKWSLATKNLEFVSPVAICADGRGGFLVTDPELQEIFRLDGAGNPIGRFGHDELLRPTGIARDPEARRIYVADTEAHQLKVYNDDGVLVGTIGQRGTRRGEFNFPTMVTVSGGEIYVSDTLNFRVQIVRPTGEGRLTFGELGLYVGNLTRPKGVAVGHDGRIYVVESYYDHLLVFDKEGEFLLPIGGTGKEVGEFYLPSGVWTDADGRVYIADMFNGRVVVLQELRGGRGA